MRVVMIFVRLYTDMIQMYDCVAVCCSVLQCVAVYTDIIPMYDCTYIHMYDCIRYAFYRVAKTYRMH